MKKKAEVMEEDVELEEDVDQIDEAGMIPSGRKKELLKKKVTNKMWPPGAGPRDGMPSDFGKNAKVLQRLTRDDNKKTVSEEEINEEEIELSEELESFIDQCLEEGMDEDQIAEAIDENFEFVTEEAEEESVMEDYEVDMSEHVDALLAGEELSEEFRAKATAIFEAAVKQKVAEEVAVLEEAFAATLEEEIGRTFSRQCREYDESFSLYRLAHAGRPVHRLLSRQRQWCRQRKHCQEQILLDIYCQRHAHVCLC
jgi:hypothetical protein